MAKTKCVVIREELVALAGDYKRAIVLGQLIYWSERVQDRSLFIEEEHQRDIQQDGPILHGWFYKRAEELSEETMMGVKPKAMREYVKHLVEQGWVFEQRNPKDKMDRTLNYRVNLVKIHHDLVELGYSLKRCTTHLLLGTGGKESAAGKKDCANSDKNSPTDEKEAGTISKPPSNHFEETLATSEKETTPAPKPLEITGLKACDFTPEITIQRLQDSEITHTPHCEDRVCVRIQDLFGKKLSKPKVRALIRYAEKEGVNLDEEIKNTHLYHTRIEKCRSIFGAIQYAIESGGWELQSVSSSTKPFTPLTKAVQEQRDRKNAPKADPFDPEFIAMKKKIREQMELLGYVCNEGRG